MEGYSLPPFLRVMCRPWVAALQGGREEFSHLVPVPCGEGVSSTSTFQHMAMWVSQTSFVLAGCPLLEYECPFHYILEGRVYRESSLLHDADVTLPTSTIFRGAIHDIKLILSVVQPLLLSISTTLSSSQKKLYPIVSNIRELKYF